jgi:hypothetical protein
MEAPQIQGSVLMYIGPPLCPSYIGEKRTIFAKAYGMKVRCLYGEHVDEHIVNLGNIVVHIRNLEGTPWEHVAKQGKMKPKKVLPALQT